MALLSLKNVAMLAVFLFSMLSFFMFVQHEIHSMGKEALGINNIWICIYMYTHICVQYVCIYVRIYILSIYVYEYKCFEYRSYMYIFIA
jgi:hypothetical protein